MIQYHAVWGVCRVMIRCDKCDMGYRWIIRNEQFHRTDWLTDSIRLQGHDTTQVRHLNRDMSGPFWRAGTDTSITSRHRLVRSYLATLRGQLWAVLLRAPGESPREDVELSGATMPAPTTRISWSRRLQDHSFNREMLRMKTLEVRKSILPSVYWLATG